ncbi:uncharacterized protein BJ171DRAFT_521432 [Polychytrium aggregatum]|uniref:uncharacterized protein n=1 Tax=Polychytrium aggregatum TaxID=110093 RepID=UPI0022FEEF2C|nr:uncharacterized protein BJ171DRAFT_521432 [Polychytrium aggregatum]KAI9197181.1 hypothetical protein BJ171DRAFT_521432 [Polychytrium aggregatum]
MIVRPRVLPDARLPLRLPALGLDEPVDIRSISTGRHLILITIKNLWCPVCPHLLNILTFLGFDQGLSQPISITPNAAPRSLVDPFNQSVRSIPEREVASNRHLLTQDAAFLILTPGPRDEAVVLRQSLGGLWNSVPFVLDDGLWLAGMLGLRFPMGIVPACCLVKEDGSLEEILIGRGEGYYGDDYIMKFLRRSRFDTENDAQYSITVTRIMAETLGNKVALGRYTFAPLPPELLGRVLAYLGDRDLVCAAATSTSWRRTALDVVRKRLVAAISGLQRALPRSANGTITPINVNTGCFPEDTVEFGEGVKKIDRLRDELMELRDFAKAMLVQVGL